MQPGSRGTRVRVRVAEPAPHLSLLGRRSRRLLKWVGWTTLGVSGLLIVLLIAIPPLIDWNATFRPALVEAVRQVSGRELSVGRIEMRFRPLPTLELQALSLGGASGTDPAPVVSVPEARASFRLLPLLGRQLIIREITLEAPEINLAIDRRGQPNWRSGGSSGDDDAGDAAAGSADGLAFATVALEAITIEDGTLRFENAQLDQQIVVDDVDIDGALDARGSTSASLVQSIEAKLALSIGSLTATDLPVSRVDGLRATIAVPGDSGQPSIEANGEITVRGADEPAGFELSGTVGRLTELLADEVAYPFQLKARTGEIEATVTGRLHDLPGALRPELDLQIRAPTLAAFAPFTGSELPEFGPFDLNLKAAFASQARLVVDTLEARLAHLALSAAGEIDDADSADPKPRFKVQMSGRSLAELRPLLGAAAPDLGPFEIAAELATAGQQATVRDLAAQLAGSDLAGEVDITLEPPRPEVRGSLSSTTLDLAELRAAIAGGDGRPERAPPAGRKLFAETPLPFDTLRGVDLDLALEVAKLVVSDRIQLADTALKVGLADGRLTLDPFATRLASGGLKGTLSVDARQAPPSLSLAMDAEQIRLGELLRGLELIDLGTARADGSLNLTARGATPQQIVGSLAGETYLSGRGGEVELGALVSLVSGLDDIFRPLLGGREEIPISCFVDRFVVSDGVMTSQVQMLSTSSFAVAGSGTIDLAREQLDLRFTTAARRPSLASFAVPFRVRGPIGAPEAYPDPLGTIFTAAKVAGMIVDPVATVGALVAGGLDHEGGCEAAIERATRGAAQPSPGGAVDRPGASGPPGN